MNNSELYAVAKDIGKKLGNTAKTLKDIGLQKRAEFFAWLEKTTKPLIRDGKEILLTELPPINVSMVAPSGAGKTTLLSTVMMHTEHVLNVAKGFEVRPESKNDKIILAKYDEDLHSSIHAGNIKINTGMIKGTITSKKYTFEIVYENIDKQICVKQPFVLMDIPGAWLDVAKRPEVEYKDFQEHLHKSTVLWVPVETPLLMRAFSEQEKASASRLMKANVVQQIIHEWVKYRANDKDEPASIFFAPTKCETWFSQDRSGQEAVKVYGQFYEVYQKCISDIKQTANNCRVYYAPLESIGCISMTDYSWKDGEFEADYNITQPRQRIVSGAEALTFTIYKDGAEKIIDAFDTNMEHLKKALETKNPIEWVIRALTGVDTKLEKVFDDMKDMRENIKMISGELKRISDMAWNYKYFKEL